MKKFILLVGSGFTTDFTKQYNLDPSKPLQCFENSDINYNKFINNLPAIKEELIPILSYCCDDFDAIKVFFERNQSILDKDCQLRRFLALSYSCFQTTAEKYNLPNWRWVKWLSRNHKHLHIAISFNYDLILEKSLKLSKIKYYRIGTNEVPKGIPIIKPHGSLDFDLPDGGISISVENRWKITTSLNQVNGHVKVIPKSEWMLPRIEADIIPPSQHNYQLKLNWVVNGFNQYARIKYRNDIDAFVIVGHSYRQEDRPEIDFFLEKLKKTTKIFIIDPYPKEELIQKIKSLGLTINEPNKSGLPW